MLVELSSIETVENVVTISLWGLLEDFQIFENLWIDRNLIIETNTILSKEVEDHSIRRLECDVFVLQRATTNGFSLVLCVFLVSSTQRELVDQIDCRSSLSISHKL